MRDYRLHKSAYRLLGGPPRRNRQNNSEHAGRWRPFGLVLLRRLVFRKRDLRVLDRAPSEERVSHRTALGKWAARAIGGRAETHCNVHLASGWARLLK